MTKAPKKLKYSRFHKLTHNAVMPNVRQARISSCVTFL